MAEFDINLKLSELPTDLQIKKLKTYFKEIPLSEILSGLKFANNRWVAKDAGVLKVGRKSILQKEIQIQMRYFRKHIMLLREKQEHLCQSHQLHHYNIFQKKKNL